MWDLLTPGERDFKERCEREYIETVLRIKQLLYDEGKPANPNFSDYRLPTIGDVPAFQQIFADSYEPSGPYGAKGVGEIAIDCVTGLLANAIADATGVRLKTLPLTAEKVFRALHPDVE